MRVLVDTNVYLEYLLSREKYQIARDFFCLAALRNNEIYISAMSLRDIGYVIQRKVHNKKLASNLQNKAYEISTKVAPVSADAAICSLTSGIDDFEDSMLIYAAEEAMCDAIVTFNKKDFYNTKMPIFTPEEINTIWRKQLLNEQ